MKKIFAMLAAMFLLAMTSCGSSGGGGGSSDNKATGEQSSEYSQSDLTGTWNFTYFQTGGTPGWERGALSIDNNGTASYIAYENSLGDVTKSGGSISFVLDSSGIVTESLPVKSHCNISDDKKTIVCAETNDTDSTAYGTRILVKTTGVVFSNADLTGPLSFNYQAINSGASSEWEYGAGTINDSRQATYTQILGPEGTKTIPSANSNSYTVGSDGFAALNINGTAAAGWRGMLSSDKKMMIVTSGSSSPESYALAVYTIADQTFSGVSDLAGDWKWIALWGGSDFGWERGTERFNSSGILSCLSRLNSNGEKYIGGDTAMAMTADGILTLSGHVLHGVLSHDRIIIVSTHPNYNYQLDILMR
jgi:hypothetical protein